MEHRTHTTATRRVSPIVAALLVVSVCVLVAAMAMWDTDASVSGLADSGPEPEEGGVAAPRRGAVGSGAPEALPERSALAPGAEGADEPFAVRVVDGGGPGAGPCRACRAEFTTSVTSCRVSARRRDRGRRSKPPFRP